MTKKTMVMATSPHSLRGDHGVPGVRRGLGVESLDSSVYTFGIIFQYRDSGLKKLIPGSIPGFLELELVQK